MLQSMGRREFMRILAGIAVTGLALGTTGCSAYPSVDEALDSIAKNPQIADSALLQAGTLTFGVNTSNAPYCWTSSSSSELQGLDIDVALVLADYLGLSAKFVNVGDTYNGASGGVCDIVLGVTTSTIPNSEVLIGNYAETAPSVFAKNRTSTVSDADLNSAAVGVQADSPSARACEAIAPDVNFTTFSTLNDAFSALEAGSVDFVACESFLGGYLASAYEDINLVGAFSLATTRGVGIAATNSVLQSAVTSAFDALLSNGMLSAIRTRWVGDLSSITTTNQVLITMTSDETYDDVGDES